MAAIILPNGTTPLRQGSAMDTTSVRLIAVGPDVSQDRLPSNACSCGLGELADFLQRSAKKVTVYPSPASCTCYAISSDRLTLKSAKYVLSAPIRLIIS